MLDLLWRPRAQLDRKSIAIYLGYECKSPQAALNAMKAIDKAIERIRLFPDSGGHFRDQQLSCHDYRTALAGTYTIYYRYDEKSVTIYRILHQRRDLDTYDSIFFE